MQRSQWHPTPVLLPGKSHGWRSLGGLQSMGSLRVGHDWATSLSLFTFLHWRKWQPPPVFLPGEFQEQGSLVGFRLWGRTESDTTERLNWTELNYFTTLYWFCHTSTWLHHGCTRIPHPEPPPTSFSIPSLWVIPVHQPQASCILHRTWTGDSFHIWYFTCFNAILPNHPTLALSHRIQKTVLYICVSFAILHTGLSLPSF